MSRSGEQQVREVRAGVSGTRPTAANNSSKAGRVSPTRFSFADSTLRRPLFSSGYCSASRCYFHFRLSLGDRDTGFSRQNVKVDPRNGRQSDLPTRGDKHLRLYHISAAASTQWRFETGGQHHDRVVVSAERNGLAENVGVPAQMRCQNPRLITTSFSPPKDLFIR